MRRPHVHRWVGVSGEKGTMYVSGKGILLWGPDDTADKIPDAYDRGTGAFFLRELRKVGIKTVRVTCSLHKQDTDLNQNLSTFRSWVYRKAWLEARGLESQL